MVSRPARAYKDRPLLATEKTPSPIRSCGVWPRPCGTTSKSLTATGGSRKTRSSPLWSSGLAPLATPAPPRARCAHTPANRQTSATGGASSTPCAT